MADDLNLFGRDLFGEAIKPKASGPVAQRFTFPPFTVLDARAGDWQDRKRAWALMGIASEVGREDNLIGYSQACVLARGVSGEKETSMFDPVLCELIYRWFTPAAGQVVDPFAGGSVRGIVAGALGRAYWGSDLRPEQVQVNIAQADAIDPSVCPFWVCGDSRDTVADAPAADLLFTCPPYGDLERYSDLAADLSTLSWTGFTIAYRLILTRTVAKLKPNRFAAIVVGNFRDAAGHYRDLVGETVATMQAAGLHYYNEAVLVTSVGSAAMRVTRQFAAGRKFCKTHQNLLVFVKGDWRKAAAACGDISVL